MARVGLQVPLSRLPLAGPGLFYEHLQDRVTDLMSLHEEAPQLRPYNDDLASAIYTVLSSAVFEAPFLSMQFLIYLHRNYD